MSTTNCGQNAGHQGGYSIHDHTGSDCAFLIVSGVSTETVYETNEEGLAYPVSDRDTCQERFVLQRSQISTEFQTIKRTNRLICMCIPWPLSEFKIYAPAETSGLSLPSPGLIAAPTSSW